MMDLLRAYFDLVSSVPLWVWPLFLYWYFKYALPSMTQVLHEIIALWLDDETKYYSNFDDNNLLELVLQGPSTFDLAISQLQSSEHRHVQEVALWNYSSHTTVKIMETKAVVQVFEALARLPDLKKVSISFNSPFPVAALTAFFKERRALREQSGRHWLTMPWKTYTSTYGSSDEDGLRELSLYVVELAGTDVELHEFCQQLASFHGLERLELRSDPSPTAGMNHRNSFQTNRGPRPHHQQNGDDEEEMAWVDLHKHRLEQNERALVPILSALEQHPTLTQLALAATLPNTKQTTAAITFSLSNFVTNNQCLQFLKLHLQRKKFTGTTTDGSDPSRIFPDDGWYFVPLAQALAQPSLNATSQLWHLHLTHHNVRRQGTLYETIRSNADNLRPNKTLQKEFKTMLRHNYNLRLVTMGNWSDDNIRYDDDDLELLGEPIITLSPRSRTVDMDAQWNSNMNSRSFVDEMDIGMHPSFRRPPPPPPPPNMQLLAERMGPEMMGEIAPLMASMRAREEQLAEEPKKKEEEYDPSMDFFLGLNRRGRKRLLGHANNQNDIAADEWIQAIVDADTKGRDRKQFGLSTTFYWLSMNPSLIRGGTTR